MHDHCYDYSPCYLDMYVLTHSFISLIVFALVNELVCRSYLTFSNKVLKLNYLAAPVATNI